MSVENRRNDSDREHKYCGKSVPVQLCPPKIRHGPARYQIRVSGVTGRLFVNTSVDDVATAEIQHDERR